VPSYNFLFPIPGIFGFLGYISASTSGTPGNFTFVSTASALDASPYTTPVFSEKYVNGVNQNYPSTSETFIAQETNTTAGTTNNVHIRFTARNSQWLFNEMENLPNLENCSSECSNPYYIAGDNSFCTSGTYSIPGLQRGATVSWAVSPTGIVTPNSSTTNPVTFTKVSDGSFRLTATITNACGSSPVTIRRNLIAGPPAVSIIGPYDPVQHTIMGVACIGQQYYFVASDVEPGQSYTWTLFPPAGSNDLPSLYSGSTVYLTFNETGNYILRVSKSNSCGSTFTDATISPQQCFLFSITASPNPTSDVLNITIDNETAEVQSLDPNQNMLVELFNFNYTSKKKQWIFKNYQKQLSLNLNGLTKGTYILRVTKGDYKQVKKIILQ